MSRKSREQQIEEYERARHELLIALVAALHLEQILDWIDGQLRRWPWLYHKLGGSNGA